MPARTRTRKRVAELAQQVRSRPNLVCFGIHARKVLGVYMANIRGSRGTDPGSLPRCAVAAPPDYAAELAGADHANGDYRYWQTTRTALLVATVPAARSSHADCALNWIGRRPGALMSMTRRAVPAGPLRTRHNRLVKTT